MQKELFAMSKKIRYGKALRTKVHVPIDSFLLLKNESHRDEKAYRKGKYNIFYTRGKPNLRFRM